MQDYSKQGIAVSKTDLLKILSYLGDACRLYEALPMQSMRSRAHMIRQLCRKIQSRINR